MRATALLLLLNLAACGRVENVELTAKLVMSRFPADWCGSMNPDAIRMSCAAELGLYIVQDDNKKVLQSTCVKLDADANRTWGNLTETLNSNMVKLEKIAEGPTVRLELAVIEPVAGMSCEYQASVAAASFYGKSEPITLMGNELTRRVDVATKCLKAFSACPP